MFEHLDDPYPFAPLGDLDAARDRGKRVRAKRRFTMTGASALTLIALLGVAAVALPDDGDTDGIAADETVATVPTTTAVRPSTTVPGVSDATTPISVAPPTTTAAPAPNTAPRPTTPVAPAFPTTPNTPKGPNDWSALTVDWSPPALTLPAGGSAAVSYTVTNRGEWPVDIADGDCQEQGLTPSGISDGIYPAPSTEFTTETCVATRTRRLEPGQSVQYSDTILAGRRLPNGQVFPIAPVNGLYSLSPKPWQFGCARFCDAYRGNGPLLRITALDAVNPPFSISLDATAVSVPSGGSTQVTLTYTNELAAEIRHWVTGAACLVSIDAVNAICEENATRVWVAASSQGHFSVQIWATAGWKAGAAPLAPGTYSLPVAGMQIAVTVT
ncbi:MAG: hypothetical protein ACT4OX_12740 [Actinomycetota bacterium]